MNLPVSSQAGSEFSCGKHGRLRADLVGGISTAVDWGPDTFECESMQRPDADGIRLRFSGRVAGEQLAIIIAIPGLRSDHVDIELPSNVTASVEGSGRFFSTPDLNSCWTDVASQSRLPDDDGVNNKAKNARARYTITATLNCVAPLGELNGDAAITISELSFTSIVDWSST